MSNFSKAFPVESNIAGHKHLKRDWHKSCSCPYINFALYLNIWSCSVTLHAFLYHVYCGIGLLSMYLLYVVNCCYCGVPGLIDGLTGGRVELTSMDASQYTLSKLSSTVSKLYITNASLCADKVYRFWPGYGYSCTLL